MARVPHVLKDQLPPEQQDLLARDITLYRVLAHSPAAARAWHGVGHYIRYDSKLAPRLRELAILQVGYLARAPYEWSHHVKIGYDFGVTDDDIRALVAETEGRASSLEPLARTVLQAAREITAEGALRDATAAALQAELSHELFVDLLLVIAFYNGVVRFLAAAEVEVEPEYQTYLERHPLPEG